MQSKLLIVWLFISVILIGCKNEEKIKEAENYYKEAQVETSNGNLAEAINKLTKSIDLVQDSSKYYGMRGAIRWDYSGNPDAIEDLSMAIKLNPNDPRPYDTRAKIRFIKEDWTGAFEDCNRIVEIDVNYSDVHTLRGFCRMQMTLQKLHEKNNSISLTTPQRGELEKYEEYREAAKLSLDDYTFDIDRKTSIYAASLYYRGQLTGNLDDVNKALDLGFNPRGEYRK